MNLTTAQLATFKADIQTNQAANLAAGNHGAIALYYNSAGTGTVWRPNIDVSELNTAIVWSDFAALTVAKQNTYLAMITAGFVDATNANIRAGFTTVFGGGSQSLTNLTALAQRVPTRFEQLFTTSQVSATFGQSVSVADIVFALNS